MEQSRHALTLIISNSIQFFYYYPACQRMWCWLLYTTCTKNIYKKRFNAIFRGPCCAVPCLWRNGKTRNENTLWCSLLTVTLKLPGPDEFVILEGDYYILVLLVFIIIIIPVESIHTRQWMCRIMLRKTALLRVINIIKSSKFRLTALTH